MLGGWSLLALALACRSEAGPAQPTGSNVGSVSQEERSGEPDGAEAPLPMDSHRAASEPHVSEPHVAEIPLESGFPVLTWAPRSAASAPLIVSAHGAGCVAEDHCAYLWRLSGGRAVVACLRGDPLYRQRPEQGFYFRDHFALRAELEAAVSAVRQHFGDRLKASATFVGYSQGATMGALALPSMQLAFRELIFIEGGGEGMPRASAERLRALGTERVLFACGTKGCAKRSQATAALLTAVGLEARALEAPGAGHTYLGAVEELVSSQTRWLWP